MKHAGQVVTRTMLLEHVWDYHFDPQTNVIDVHVSRLRAKIDKNFDKPLLHTVRGAGYTIRDGLVSLVRRRRLDSALPHWLRLRSRLLVCAAAIVRLLVLANATASLTDQVLETLDAEAEPCERGRAGGEPELVRAVEQRAPPGAPASISSPTQRQQDCRQTRTACRPRSATAAAASSLSAADERRRTVAPRRSPFPSTSAPTCISSSGATSRISAASPTRCGDAFCWARRCCR